jgi:hypothetical protein
MKTFESAAILQSTQERLGAITPDSPRQWGRMTVHQMVCHLSDSFDVAMGGMTVSMATGLPQRTVMKFGALYVPLRWPKGAQTRPEIDQAAGGGTQPLDFERDRARLLAAMRRFAASKPDFEWHVHPFFGNMSRWEWMRWGYLHTDHHLRQFGG